MLEAMAYSNKNRNLHETTFVSGGCEVVCSSFVDRSVLVEPPIFFWVVCSDRAKRQFESLFSIDLCSASSGCYLLPLLASASNFSNDVSGFAVTW